MHSRVEIIGHLGGNPQTRLAQNGASVCSFSVATARTWTNNDGSKGKETTWWQVSAWGRLGEVCQQYLTKGRLVFIEGQLKPNPRTGSPNIWMDQNGQPRASYELRASSMKMLGSRDGYGGSHQNQGHNQGYQNQAHQNQAHQNQAHQNQTSTRQSPPRAQRPAPRQQTNGGRRSTMSAPQPDEFVEDEFGPEEIPF